LCAIALLKSSTIGSIFLITSSLADFIVSSFSLAVLFLKLSNSEYNLKYLSFASKTASWASSSSLFSITGADSSWFSS
jgi:hypothetical protein